MSRRSELARRRRRTVKRILTLMIVTICVLTFFLVFRLKTVRVRGAVHEQPDEITALLLERPVLGNTLLAALMNNNRTISPPGFVDYLTVSVTGIDSLRVVVHERDFVGCAQYDGTWYYFDSSGYVLATASATADGDLIPVVEGLEIAAAPSVNETLQISNTKAFSMLGMLKSQIHADTALLPDRVVFDGSSMDLVYGSVTVLLGNGERLEMRLKELEGVLPELTNGSYKGTLHLESYDGTQSGLVFDRDDDA